jgi:hypothetical protein
MVGRSQSALLVQVLLTLGWTSFCLAQIAPPVSSPAPPPAPGCITGIVADQSGAVIAGAQVSLTRPGGDQSFEKQVLSDGDGEFSFTNIAPGPFQLTIVSAGFTPKTSSGILHPGEVDVIPEAALAVATNTAAMEVTLTQTEVAEEQVKAEEKQRVLGILPNFYVSYDPHAVPLNPRQKFNLAWKTLEDPFTFVMVAGSAGVEQAQNHFAGYGQGAQGYAKRFGANYADAATGTLIGGAILPSLLKQDPRYFYKGVGSVRSRFLYAIANSLICKGDNGRWQANYSNILGSMASGGLSNLYYPSQDRNGVGLTFENAAIGIGATAIGNVFQEFVIKRLTPKLPNYAAAKP